MTKYHDLSEKIIKEIDKYEFKKSLYNFIYDETIDDVLNAINTSNYDYAYKKARYSFGCLSEIFVEEQEIKQEQNKKYEI